MPQEPHILLAQPSEQPTPQVQAQAVCPLAADGLCTIIANGLCGTEKELDITIPNLLNLSAQGYLDRIEVMWSTAISYPDQVVRMFYREYDVDIVSIDYFDSPKAVPRDDGMIATVNTLQPRTIYEMFLRAENATHYGYWQKIEVLTDPNWNTDSEIVIHAGEFVYHVNDIVLYDD